MPRGRRLQFDILTTWGDPYYVGLTGIEIFDDVGHPIHFPDPKAQIRADPADINVLPEYSRDPRVVANLLDGTFLTCDDMHLWLAPFTAGRRNLIFLDLGDAVAVSMIRIWNYNKSRIHSFRGARHIEVRVDQVVAFRGEINKAPGNVADSEAAAEVLLFTVDEVVLQRIDAYDQQQLSLQAELPTASSRPLTANKEDAGDGISSAVDGSGEGVGGGGGFGGGGGGAVPQLTPWGLRGADEPANELRPTAAQVPMEVRSARSRPMTAAVADGGGGGGFQPTLPPVQDYETALHPKGSWLTLVLSSTWGDAHYVGLTGIELLDPNGRRIDALRSAHVSADPHSVTVLPNMHADPRTPDKLIDGVNATLDDRHMWLTPHSPGATATVVVKLPRPVVIGAVRLWNYAKTPSRGVKGFSLLLDGAIIFEGCMRAAPPREQLVSEWGAAPADFVQTVIFTDNQAVLDAEREHVYNQEELDDEIVCMDNGKLVGGKKARMDTFRPTTAAHGLGSARGASRLPRR